MAAVEGVVSVKHKALYFIFLLVLLSSVLPAPAQADAGAVIYENEACGHCTPYVHELKSVLVEFGIAEIEEKYMINNLSVRAEVEALNKRFGIPLHLQGHMVSVVGETLVLEGHVPVEMLREFFRNHPKHDFPRAVIYQDSMAEFRDLRSYKVLVDGETRRCEISIPIQECIGEGSGEMKVADEFMLPLIIATGLVDGINPCAFGVLLFFIALLFTLKRTRKDLFKVGGVYIFVIFLTYFFIGIGIMQAILITAVPHLMARVAAVLILILGLVSIKDYFWYGGWFSLSIPKSQTGRIKELMVRATLPSTVVLGFLVGLCTFPCSGGIYVGILSLLSVTTTYLQGLGYLVIYNIMFVLPLVIILLLATNRRVVKRMEAWEKSEKKHMKLLAGIVMIALSLFILFSGII